MAVIYYILWAASGLIFLFAGRQNLKESALMLHANKISFDDWLYDALISIEDELGYDVVTKTRVKPFYDWPLLIIGSLCFGPIVATYAAATYYYKNLLTTAVTMAKE